jgi:hypothetical protein
MWPGELAAAGTTAHLAETADTAAARGRKKRAKTDRADARLMRDLCVPITSSTSCHQVIFVDHAVGLSLSSDAVQVEIARLG